MRVRLDRSSDEWPLKYERVSQQIGRVLGVRAKRVEHIGSTAVPGLDAKPIVDILLELDDVDDQDIHQALAGIGLAPIVDEPGHRMFRTAAGDVHVHLWASDDSEIERHILFRDWLRENEMDRRLYKREKYRLAAMEWPTQNDYAEAKTPVINEIVARARESRRA